MKKEIKERALEMVLRLLTTKEKEVLLSSFKVEQLEPAFVLDWIKRGNK